MGIPLIHDQSRQHRLMVMESVILSEQQGIPTFFFQWQFWKKNLTQSKIRVFTISENKNGWDWNHPPMLGVWPWMHLTLPDYPLVIKRGDMWRQSPLNCCWSGKIPLKWGQFPLTVPNPSGDRSLRSLRGEFGGGAEERFQGSQGGAALRMEVLEDQVFGRYIQKNGGAICHI